MPTYLPPFDIADDALAKQWRQWQPKDFAPNGKNGKNKKDHGKEKDSHDENIFEKIVDVFRPKHEDGTQQ